jgi:hypothetical protein
MVLIVVVDDDDDDEMVVLCVDWWLFLDEDGMFYRFMKTCEEFC